MARVYGRRRSLALPAVWAAQNEGGGVLSTEAIEEVAEIVGVTPAQVQEVVGFYSMYRRKRTGRYVVSVCKTLACATTGAEGLVRYLAEKLGIQVGETTPDGLFSLETSECLGACAWAPVMLINDTLHILLTPAKVDALLDQCRASGPSTQRPETQRPDREGGAQCSSPTGRERP
jgi:NADH-quinone oxidoreductase subunit E